MAARVCEQTLFAKVVAAREQADRCLRAVIGGDDARAPRIDKVESVGHIARATDGLPQTVMHQLDALGDRRQFFVRKDGEYCGVFE